jgi:hypothetical protein
MERNRRHFGQAHRTPFTQAPLADLINWQADTDTAELILHGNYNNDDLDDVTQLLKNKRLKSIIYLSVQSRRSREEATLLLSSSTQISRCEQTGHYCSERV